MIPTIYFIIALAYGTLLLGIFLRDIPISLLGCLFLFGLSVYTFSNGIDVFAHDNVLVISFSAITFGIASYISFLGTKELMGK